LIKKCQTFIIAGNYSIIETISIRIIVRLFSKRRYSSESTNLRNPVTPLRKDLAMLAPTNRVSTMVVIFLDRMSRGKGRRSSYLGALQGVSQGAAQALPSEGPFVEPCNASSVRPFAEPCNASCVTSFARILPPASCVTSFARILPPASCNSFAKHLHQLP
jgi:hypothetical protein